MGKAATSIASSYNNATGLRNPCLARALAGIRIQSAPPQRAKSCFVSNFCGFMSPGRQNQSHPHRDGTSNSDGKPGEPRLSPSHSCRFVVLTTKAATTCLVCARPGASATPALSPYFPASGRPPSPAFAERRSPTPPSPSSSSLSTPSGGQRTSHLGGQRRPSGGGGGRLSSSLGAGSAGGVAGDHEHLDVSLLSSCRFNHDLLLASISRCAYRVKAAPSASSTSSSFVFSRPFGFRHCLSRNAKVQQRFFYL